MESFSELLPHFSGRPRNDTDADEEATLAQEEQEFESKVTITYHFVSESTPSWLSSARVQLEKIRCADAPMPMGINPVPVELVEEEEDEEQLFDEGDMVGYGGDGVVRIDVPL